MNHTEFLLIYFLSQVKMLIDVSYKIQDIIIIYLLFLFRHILRKYDHLYIKLLYFIYYKLLSQEELNMFFGLASFILLFIITILNKLIN